MADCCGSDVSKAMDGKESVSSDISVVGEDAGLSAQSPHILVASQERGESAQPPQILVAGQEGGESGSLVAGKVARKESAHQDFSVQDEDDPPLGRGIPQGVSVTGQDEGDLLPGQDEGTLLPGPISNRTRSGNGKRKIDGHSKQLNKRICKINNEI